MKISYDADADMLTLHSSDMAIARETYPNENTCICYAEDGSVVAVLVTEVSQFVQLRQKGTSVGTTVSATQRIKNWLTLYF